MTDSLKEYRKVEAEETESGIESIQESRLRVSNHFTVSRVVKSGASECEHIVPVKVKIPHVSSADSLAIISDRLIIVLADL